MDYGGSLEKLTTPEIKEFDSVFPGENWFFYWKTSPSLWETKLRTYRGPGPIYIPIYWALHSEFVNQYDFGQQKPEADLKRLIQIVYNLGHEAVLLVPLTPCPFLANGGIPSYVTRSVAVGEDGVALACWDGQDNLYKMYSFFDPQVFQAHRKFCWNLGQYLSQAGVGVKVFGLNSKKIEDSSVVSFFDDYSQSFEKGFNRFVKQTQDSEPERIEKLVREPAYEQVMRKEYRDMVYQLYLGSCQELLAGHWSGVIESTFVGASSVDLMRRTHPLWEAEHFYYDQLFKTHVNNEFPNSVILGYEGKKGSLKNAFSAMVNSSSIQSQVDNDYYADDSSLSFRPLYHFEVYCSPNENSPFVQSGLKHFLDHKFSWQYSYNQNNLAQVEDSEEEKVHFFYGTSLNEKSLTQAIKIFLNGQKVFIDTAGISEKLHYKIKDFFTENNLNVESVNYLSPIDKVSLGDGLIVTYNTDKLSETSFQKKQGFWQKLIEFVDIKNLFIDADKDVYFLWFTRPSNSFELSYEEVRRVCFFNPSSYKRKAFIKSSSNFAFVKSLDLENCQVRSTPIGIEVELLPGAYSVLDFGYFEA